MTRTDTERKQEADQIRRAYAALGKQALWADGKGGGFWVKDAKPAYRSLAQARQETRESRRFLLGDRVMVGSSETGTIIGYNENPARYTVQADSDDDCTISAHDRYMTRVYTSDTTDWCAFDYAPYPMYYRADSDTGQWFTRFRNGTAFAGSFSDYAKVSS